MATTSRLSATSRSESRRPVLLAGNDTGDSRRLLPRSSLGTFLRANASAGLRFVGSYLPRGDRIRVEAPRPRI
jgi:hypothetical protein